MKSVGEAMAIGRNFTEALQKALRSLEKADAVFDWHQEWVDLDKEALLEEIKVPHDGRLKKVMDALRAGATADEVFAATHIDPWFVDQLLLINEVAAEVTGAAELTPAILRRAKRHGFSDAQIGKIRGMTADVVRGVRHALGHPAGVQDRRHLRGRVRGRDAVPLLVLRRGDRGRAAREAGGDHPRLRTQPDRAGHRVRLLVRARVDGAVRGRLRDRDGQLQPRDRLDRLRHLRPALLRAADPGGRARDRARRAAGRPDRRRDLPARRPDAARPGAGARGQRRADRRHLARGDPPRRGARRVRAGAARGRAQRPQARHGVVLHRGARDRRDDRLPGAGASVVRPRRPRHGDRLRRRGARGLHPPGDRDQPRAPGPGRPVHRRRGRDRRGRALRRRGAVPRRRHGAHRGGGHPLRRLLVRAAADHPGGVGDPADPRGHRGDRPRRRGARADQHPVRARLRRPLRARGQPAGLAHGAVRLQGDRDPAGQGRGPDHARRDHRGAARHRDCCPRPATAARCRPTSRSRSRKP